MKGRGVEAGTVCTVVQRQRCSGTASNVPRLGQEAARSA